MNYFKKFKETSYENISKMSKDANLKNISNEWIKEITQYKWAFNFEYLGLTAIQFPNDVWALQEIIWKTKPDLIIETGVAHGGSLIFSASMLAILDLSEKLQKKEIYDPKESKKMVLGIDIEIRKHNKQKILDHPFSNYIELIEGSSTDKELFQKVLKIAKSYNNVLVILDSNHSHDHVLEELKLYSQLINIGSYCIVLDTIIEDMPKNFFNDRPWDKGNNPKTAVYEFLKNNSCFEIDNQICNKLLITVAPDGFLKRKK